MSGMLFMYVNMNLLEVVAQKPYKSKVTPASQNTASTQSYIHVHVYMYYIHCSTCAAAYKVVSSPDSMCTKLVHIESGDETTYKAGVYK